MQHPDERFAVDLDNEVRGDTISDALASAEGDFQLYRPLVPTASRQSIESGDPLTSS
jgi:hypothetical protein